MCEGFVQGSTSGGSPAPGIRPRFDEDVQLPLIKVVVLGAPGVGKTSLVMRFMDNKFNPDHCLTTKKAEFYPSLILNGNLFELKLIDLPVIPYFPANGVAEWNDFRSFGLRSASAYLLVYDLSVPSTFNFVKNLRDQICNSRDMTNVPVIVIANKVDLVATKNFPQAQKSKKLCHDQQHRLHQRFQFQPQQSEMVRSQSSNNPKELLANGSDSWDVSQTVQKVWRSSYIKCSAKYNWNVTAVFRELAITLNMIANGQTIEEHPAPKKKRCLLL